MRITVSPLTKDDIKQLLAFLQAVISDAFKQDGIDDAKGEQEEIAKQLQRMKTAVKADNHDTVFSGTRCY